MDGHVASVEEPAGIAHDGAVAQVERIAPGRQAAGQPLHDAHVGKRRGPVGGKAGSCGGQPLLFPAHPLVRRERLGQLAQDGFERRAHHRGEAAERVGQGVALFDADDGAAGQGAQQLFHPFVDERAAGMDDEVGTKASGFGQSFEYGGAKTAWLVGDEFWKHQQAVTVVELYGGGRGALVALAQQQDGQARRLDVAQQCVGQGRGHLGPYLADEAHVGQLRGAEREEGLVERNVDVDGTATAPAERQQRFVQQAVGPAVGAGRSVLGQVEAGGVGHEGTGLGERLAVELANPPGRPVGRYD